MELPSTIAIHGVGSHRPGDIRDSVNKAFADAAMTSVVSEFPWDAFIAKSVQRVGDGLALLSETAQSISRTAALPLPPTSSPSDRVFQRVGDGLYQSAFRPLVAAVLTVLTIGPAIQLLVLLPSAVFTSISWPDLTWIGTTARLGIVAGAAVFAGMLLVDVIRSAVIRSTAPLRVTIRRAGLLVLQPLILLLTIPLAARVGDGLITFVTSAIPMLVMAGVLNLVLSPLSGKFNVMLAGAAFAVAALTTAAIAGGLHILARGLWVGGPLKVVLDIVRYMGSPTYRTTLQQAFDERIQALETDAAGERPVLLLAHSLGSVIALDSLINSTAWKPTDTVYLVTLGSPIRRSFMRFFPGYLFPPSMQRSARAAAARLRHFSWINVYRRWDYVGTSLDLNGDGLGCDRCTGQLTRVMSSHSDYWGDPVVVDVIKDALKGATPIVVAPAAASLAATHVMPDLEESDYLVAVTRVAKAAAIILIVGLVGATVVSFARTWNTWVADTKSRVAEVARSGTKALANVTYHRTLEGGGEDSYYLHHFEFQIPGLVPPLPPMEIQDGVTDYRFDYQGLAAFVLENCGRAEQKRWWQIFRSVREIPCTRTAVPLLYDAARPESVWLPQFPPREGKWEPLWKAIGVIGIGIFFAIACKLVVLDGGLRLFTLFLGLRVTTDAEVCRFFA